MTGARIGLEAVAVIALIVVVSWSLGVAVDGIWGTVLALPAGWLNSGYGWATLAARRVVGR